MKSIQKWLPFVIRRFQDQFPNIKIEIGDSRNPLEELQTKKFDIVITAATQEEENYAAASLFEDQMVCIMPQNHPLSTQPCFQLKDFRSIRLISHAEKSLSKFYQLVLKPNGIDPKRFMTINQPHAILEMVAAGFGISVFPKWAVEGSLTTYGIVALPITPAGMPVKWKAIYLKKNQIPIFQQKFIQIIGRMYSTSPAFNRGIIRLG